MLNDFYKLNSACVGGAYVHAKGEVRGSTPRSSFGGAIYGFNADYPLPFDYDFTRSR